MLNKALCLTLALGFAQSLKAMDPNQTTFGNAPMESNFPYNADPMVLAKLDVIKTDLGAIKTTINAIATQMNEEAKQKAALTQAIAQGKNPMEALMGQNTAKSN